jgi:ribosomal 50S subunit-recycling heat shock protein
VTIDGIAAKASREVHAGNKIAIAFTDRFLDFEVLDLPKGNVSKSKAQTYYRVERDEVRDALDF